MAKLERKMRRKMWQFGLLILLQPIVGMSAQHVPLQAEVDDFLVQRSRTHQELAQKILETRDSYEVVFIPGILGSKLKIGSFTYGDDPIDAKRLAFDPKQSVETATLNRFKAHKLIFSKKVDIYGSGLDLLMQGLAGKAALEFSYDWRNDIDLLADRLQEELSKKLSTKRVLVVAHSMGGVIAWHWNNKYPRKSNNVKLIGLVLLGSPLQGSCEPARMLVEGYGAAEGASTFDKVATSMVFGEAHPAIFTFPSVYQLMPRYDEANPCLKVKKSAGSLELDHHEPETWLGRQGGSYNGPRKFHDAVGLSEDEFSKRVKMAVQAGRRFRQSFDLAQSDVTTYLLYSRSVSLRKHYLVREQSDWLEIVSQPTDTAGDGRVPETSARNVGYFDSSRGGYWPLSKEHGELLADDEFSEFLRTTLKPFMTRMRQQEVLSFALQDPLLKNEILAREWILDPTVQPWLIDDQKIQQAQQVVARYTVRLLTGSPATQQNSELAKAALVKARDIEPGFSEVASSSETKLATTLYKAAFFLSPNDVDARSLNRLGLLQIKQEKYPEAVNWLTKATIVAKKKDDKYLTPDIRDKIDVNLRYAAERSSKASVLPLH